MKTMIKFNKKLYDRISKITLTSYDKEIINDYIYMSDSEIESMIEDLIYEIDDRDETIEDIKQDIEDNYRPIPKSEQYE